MMAKGRSYWNRKLLGVDGVDKRLRLNINLGDPRSAAWNIDPEWSIRFCVRVLGERWTLEKAENKVADFFLFPMFSIIFNVH